MRKLLKILALTPLLVACTSHSPKPLSIEEFDSPLPASLLVECSEYVPFPNSDMETVIIVHAENMEKAIRCKNRHNQLIEVIKDRN